jgi:hypothetical protein
VHNFVRTSYAHNFSMTTSIDGHSGRPAQPGPGSGPGGGPLNYGPGLAGTKPHRAVSCPLTGWDDSPSPGPRACSVPGQPEKARPYACTRAARSPSLDALPLIPCAPTTTSSSPSHRPLRDLGSSHPLRTHCHIG